MMTSLLGVLVLSAPVTPELQSIERIAVQGQFREMDVNETTTSVTTLTHEDTQQRGASHLEDVLNVIPNVNFSGGSSRARFIQIRGVGERSQFVDPINPSVGMLVDGINYSGLAQAAQLFDISQVEVYRGPQSGRFGADGMAGMLVLESTRATEDFRGLWNLGVANYGGIEGGLALGGNLGTLGNARLSIYQQRDDGFMRNVYLDRDDTQQRSERNLRLNVFTDLNQNWQLRSTAHVYRQDNGYDAFSLDNNRDTYSDEPGEDDLSMAATRFALHYRGFDASELLFSYSFVDADSTYSYDEDWSYVGIAPGWEYSSFDSYIRERRDHTFEARWLSTEPMDFFGLPTDFVVGVYRYQRDENLRRDFLNWDIGQQDVFNSDFNNRHTAVYGELTHYLNDEWTLLTGLRTERYSNPYSDSNQLVEQPRDTMWGGRVSLSYTPELGQMWYATVSRGYKAGGVNGEALGKVLGQNLPELEDYLMQRATFAPELLTNYEFGYKFIRADDRLMVNAAAFYQDRSNVQLKSWVNRQQMFVGYIENAASGNTQGLEFEVQYQVTEPLKVYANLGLLSSEIQGFITEEGVDISGRDLAHAPNYQLNSGATWQITDSISAGMQIDAKDGFYYSNSHQSHSDELFLVHAHVNWQLANWDLSVWARNLTDKDYGIRGFYFGNDPRDEYQPKTYVQLGEPRRVGFTARYAF